MSDRRAPVQDVEGEITYHQQMSRCGKPGCLRCREGRGHGPYWYAYQNVNGYTRRSYVGKELPANLRGESQPQVAVQVEEPAPVAVRLWLLGQLRLERRERDAASWEVVRDPSLRHQRVYALLAALLCTQERILLRDQIIEMLWPDLDLERGSARLDRAVYNLRQLLSPGRLREADSSLLVVERDMVVLADQSRLWVDADAFEEQLHRAHASTDPGVKERLLEEANILYHGKFFPGKLLSDEMKARRDALHRSWVSAQLELADQRVARGALISAISPLSALLSRDGTNEAAAQRLMRVLIWLDRRSEAIRVYKRCAATLLRDFGIAPMPETRALYESLRTMQVVRGESHPQQSGAPPRLEQIGRVHQVALVGRVKELEMVLQLLGEVERVSRFRLPTQKDALSAPHDPSGFVRCILFTGEIGIGKTRLAEEAARAALRRGWAVAWSRVYAQEGTIPYRLWTEVLRRTMAQGTWRREELTRRAAFFQPLCLLLPELRTSLLSTAGDEVALAQGQVHRLWEAVHALLVLLSESMPLLIVLDDLHWADAPSCELAAYLLRRCQRERVVIMGTLREKELGHAHQLPALLADLQREHVLCLQPLQPLTDAQIGTLVSSVSSVPTVQRITDRAAGNPFFAEELARALSETLQDDSSRLQRGQGRGGESSEEIALPESIAAALDLRLSRLTAACCSLLSKASVLGRSFSFQVIEAMEAATPGSQDEVVLGVLEEALLSGLLMEEGTGANITYQFWHPLLSSHLYEKLSAARRASLHRRAAAILEQTHQGHEEEEAATITHHLVLGGAASSRIALWAERAAWKDYALSAHYQATRHFRLAIEHLSTTADSSTEQSDARLHRALLLETLGECCISTSAFPEGRIAYQQALKLHELALQQQQAREEREVSLREEAQIRALILTEIGHSYWAETGRELPLTCYSRAEQELEQASISRAEAAPTWARIRYEQAHFYWRFGDFARAEELAKEVNALLHAALQESEQQQPLAGKPLTRIRRGLFAHPVDLSKAQQLLALLESSIRGKTLRAITYYQQVLATYEHYGLLMEKGVALSHLADLHMGRGELELSARCIQQSTQVAEGVGDIVTISYNSLNMAQLELRRGRLEEAERVARATRQRAQQHEERIALEITLSTLVIIRIEQGDVRESRDLLAQVLWSVHRTGTPQSLGYALVAAAELHLHAAQGAAGQPLTRHHHLLRAERACRRLMAQPGTEVESRVEGTVLLGELLLLDGRGAEAEVILEEAQRMIEQTELWVVESRLLRNRAHLVLAQGAEQQAALLFEEALRAARERDMRLEVAKVLESYSSLLLHKTDMLEQQRGLDYQREACELLLACQKPEGGE